MSLLGLVNFFILQWFFIRLARITRTEYAGSHLGDHYFRDVHEGWKILHFIVPLTGWWSNYIWIGGSRDR